MAERKVLIIVEGEKKDFRLMKQLFDLYLPDEYREIISYGTNLYELYGQMEKESTDWDDLDFLQVLKMHERNHERKRIFDISYTDIVLVFDFDPQDKLYNAEKLYKLMEYFSESTEHGRLYLNYPMVESFCHIRSFPDPGYGDRQVRMEELEQGKYKARVDRESCLTDIRKYDKGHMSEVIYMNLEKLRQRFFEDNLSDDLYTPLRMTLRKQNQLLAGSNWFYVLNTCVLFVYEYNSSLLN